MPYRALHRCKPCDVRWTSDQVPDTCWWAGCPCDCYDCRTSNTRRQNDTPDGKTPASKATTP